MRFWLEPNRATWNCVHCGEAGGVFRTGATQRSKSTKRNRREFELSDKQKRAEIPDNQKIAWDIWCQATPLHGTLGATYFTVHRRIDLDSLGELSHVLKCHRYRQMLVALMRDPLTGTERGIHRIFLNKDGSKRERKMLGPKGVICLTPWDEVTAGLGLSEGIEDGLKIMAGGWRPIWAAPDAGSIKSFQVIPSIEAITIFADNDQAGKDAARTCANRWIEEGQEAEIKLPVVP